jgi:hypothetical protein
MSSTEILYRAEGKSEPYAIWGGLPTQHSMYVERDHNNDEYGLGEKKLEARRDLARISPDWLHRLVAQHVTWIVADADDAEIGAAVASPEGGQQPMLVVQFGKVRVFHIE